MERSTSPATADPVAATAAVLTRITDMTSQEIRAYEDCPPELAAAVEAEVARLRSLMDGTHPVSPETAALAKRLLAAPDPEAARQVLEAAAVSGPEPEAEL